MSAELHRLPDNAGFSPATCESIIQYIVQVLLDLTRQTHQTLYTEADSFENLKPYVTSQNKTAKSKLNSIITVKPCCVNLASENVSFVEASNLRISNSDYACCLFHLVRIQSQNQGVMNLSIST